MRNKRLPGNAYETALTGGYGEQALAIYLGVEWGFRPYDITANDVAGYEVRATYHAKGRLLTHADDKNGLYVLAIVNRDDYTVNLMGWSNLKRCNTPGPVVYLALLTRLRLVLARRKRLAVGVGWLLIMSG